MIYTRRSFGSIASRMIKMEIIYRCLKPRIFSLAEKVLFVEPFTAHLLFIIRKLIIKSHPHHPHCPRKLIPWVVFVCALSHTFFRNPPPALHSVAKFLIGESWHSRINGDLIKDYSSTKIKINRAPSADRKGPWIAEGCAGEVDEGISLDDLAANGLNYTKSWTRTES